MIFLVHGQATPQTIKPHDDMLAAFPFLAESRTLAARPIFSPRQRWPRTGARRAKSGRPATFAYLVTMTTNVPMEPLNKPLKENKRSKAAREREIAEQGHMTQHGGGPPLRPGEWRTSAVAAPTAAARGGLASMRSGCGVRRASRTCRRHPNDPALAGQEGATEFPLGTLHLRMSRKECQQDKGTH